jgi:hypothetical protein
MTAPAPMACDADPIRAIGGWADFPVSSLPPDWPGDDSLSPGLFWAEV